MKCHKQLCVCVCIPLWARGVSHISQRSSRPLLENVQSGQLHFWLWWGVCGPAESLCGAPRGVMGLLFPPRRDNGVACFKRFTWGLKSSSWLAKSGLPLPGLWLVPCWSCEGVWGEPVTGESSSVLFLFLSETGEKKLRMSCCLSFSNCREEELKSGN